MLVLSGVMLVYLDKDGNVQMRKSIGYNDFLHTKLLGVLGDSFVKRSGSEYRKVYDDYKNRYQNRADWKNDKGEVSAMRCYRAAIRQAIKAFLRDLWVEWRTYYSGVICGGSFRDGTT